MSFFDRFRKKSTIPAPTDTEQEAALRERNAATVSVTPHEHAEKDVSSSATVAMDSKWSSYVLLLRRPWVSEKVSYAIAEQTYVFEIPLHAEKIAIRRAAEELYHVRVDGVRVIRQKGKPVRRGRRVSFRQDRKKALITLAKGQTIDWYKGV